MSIPVRRKGFPGCPHAVGEGLADRARRGFRHDSSSVCRVTRGGLSNGPVVAIPRRFRRGPGMARALGGGSEPWLDCIDSPHDRSVSFRASPDDPLSTRALCLLGAISTGGRRPVRALIRSSRPTGGNPVPSISCVIEVSRPSLDERGTFSDPSAIATRNAAFRNSDRSRHRQNGPSREVRIRPDEADIPAQPNQAPPQARFP